MRIRSLLVGMPESGKTTLLAALWHLVSSGECDTRLRLKRLRGDRQHLNRIRDSWLKCQPVGRTTATSEQSVSLELHDVETGRVFELTLPDMAGESFVAHWRDRRWSSDVDQLVVDASGIMLMIHPRGVNEAHSIEEADGLVNAISGSGSNASNGSADESAPGISESGSNASSGSADEAADVMRERDSNASSLLIFFQTGSTRPGNLVGFVRDVDGAQAGQTGAALGGDANVAQITGPPIL